MGMKFFRDQLMISQQLTAMNNHKNTELNQASMQFLTEQNAKATDRLILQQVEMSSKIKSL